jgi:hypothetical protein
MAGLADDVRLRGEADLPVAAFMFGLIRPCSVKGGAAVLRRAALQHAGEAEVMAQLRLSCNLVGRRTPRPDRAKRIMEGGPCSRLMGVDEVATH